MENFEQRCVQPIATNLHDARKAVDGDVIIPRKVLNEGTLILATHHNSPVVLAKKNNSIFEVLRNLQNDVRRLTNENQKLDARVKLLEVETAGQRGAIAYLYNKLHATAASLEESARRNSTLAIEARVTDPIFTPFIERARQVPGASEVVVPNISEVPHHDGGLKKS